MCRLRFFVINVRLGPATMHDYDILSFLMGSLCISLTSPATLEYLNLNIWFYGERNWFINREEEFYSDLRDAYAWTRLDSIISHPTGSRLQQVVININYVSCSNGDEREPDPDDVSDAVLDGLPLLRKKGILFVEG